MRNTRFRAVVVALSALVLASVAWTAGPAPGGLDRFKALSGEWVAAEDGEMVQKGDLVAKYSLTGAGTAVVEEVFPGSPHAMTTVYHMDGSDLVLTHYCMSGNQPRMRAKAPSGTRVAFAFDGGTNIDPRKDKHMHEATFEFLGDSEIRTTWIEFDQGKPAMTVAMHLVRKTS